jgi:cyclopropane-fatty-acyl-phospholipid synthase
MWSGIFDAFLRHLIRDGALQITLADGQVRRYGDGRGRQVAVTLHDPSLPRRIILSPDMAVGEGYMDGTLTIEDDDLYGFLHLVIRNVAAQGQPWFRRPLAGLRWLKRRVDQFNPATRARSNVAHHYDLSGALYDLFLDEDRNYSCAYFRDPAMTLEAAQEAKKRHIADKLLIEPGMHVLDIGCGWGGMGLTLARDYGAKVTGVTLSEEQHAMATARAEKAGLADKVRFELMDYRDVTGQFDRIVSIGMFEHVGVPQYDTFFDTVEQRLKPDGIALIHFIGRTGAPGATSPWILKYIFPDGYVPAMSEAAAPIERHALVTTDVEVWRLHYAQTLRAWRERFEANIDKARALYDERFCRMWRYYLIACELTFRLDGQVVFQFQLGRKQDAVPLTRDYLYRDDAAGLSHAAE